jgi:glutathione S-transferase
MITLFGSREAFGLPQVSPFVTKTEVHLKMLGLDYVPAAGFPGQSPKGQMPWIEDEGELIADSHFIRLHLERKYGADLDRGLTPLQRAQAWTIERMIEDHLRGPVAYTRWLIPENFDKGPAHFVDDAPEDQRPALREDLRRRVAENFRIQGVGRHTPDEVTALGLRSLAALSMQMGDGPYLMGEIPCAADGAAFGVVSMLLTPYFESELRTRALGFGNLVAYVDRMMGEFYPHHAWGTLKAAA